MDSGSKRAKAVKSVMTKVVKVEETATTRGRESTTTTTGTQSRRTRRRCREDLKVELETEGEDDFLIGQLVIRIGESHCPCLCMLGLKRGDAALQEGIR